MVDKMNAIACIRMNNFLFQLHRKTRGNAAAFFDIRGQVCPHYQRESLSILVDKDPHNRHGVVSVHHVVKTPVEDVCAGFPMLPLDVCRVVAEFACDHLCATFHVSFPEDYPFCPPAWSLATFDASLEKRYRSDEYGGMTLCDYHTYLVDVHNEHYREARWSPAVTVEKDVLTFIERMYRGGGNLPF